MEQEIKAQIEELKRRLARLENLCMGHEVVKNIELYLTLPEADIDGLHFNETKVHAVFEKRDDGWYYSRDILFLSARNVTNDNSRDILTEYLNSPTSGYIIYDTRKGISSTVTNSTTMWPHYIRKPGICIRTQ